MSNRTMPVPFPYYRRARDDLIEVHSGESIGVRYWSTGGYMVQATELMTAHEMQCAYDRTI